MSIIALSEINNVKPNVGHGSYVTLASFPDIELALRNTLKVKSSEDMSTYVGVIIDTNILEAGDIMLKPKNRVTSHGCNLDAGLVTSRIVIDGHNKPTVLRFITKDYYDIIKEPIRVTKVVTKQFIDRHRK